MRRARRGASQHNIPYLPDLVSFYEHVKARPPLHKDFDIREINPEVLKGHDYAARPFRHSFYCIDLLLDADVTLNAGFWKSKMSKPALYFKTPCQVLSWMKPESWSKEYFIVFTEDFMLRYKALADIIFDLPFFQMDKAIPFEIEPDEVELLAGLYKEILREYRSDNADKFDLISSYTHVLLVHVRRLYYKYAASDSRLTLHIHQSEYSLVERFRALIRKHVVTGEADSKTRSVKFFASELSTHPNHLNAIVKRQTKKTAIALIHEQLIHEAKSLLSQTPMSIKEVAFNLGFSEPSHFNHFFKKQTQLTPALYRKEKQLSFSHHSV